MWAKLLEVQCRDQGPANFMAVFFAIRTPEIAVALGTVAWEGKEGFELFCDIVSFRP